MIVSNFPGGSDVFALPLDGSKEMTGNLKLGGNQIKNIGAPEEETDAARKQEITDHNKSEDAHANILSDMVKATGGATMTMGETIGVGPYDIQITEDEDGDISASDVGYDNRASGMTATDVQGAVTELFTSVSNSKNLIAGAITDKGVSTSGDATFQQMADNIGAIETGTDTSDATATAGDILSGKTAYGAAGKITGTIEIDEGSRLITPNKYMQVAVDGSTYVTGAILVGGDTNLIPENIKSGVSIFGVAGTAAGVKTAIANISVSGDVKFKKIINSFGEIVEASGEIEVSVPCIFSASIHYSGPPASRSVTGGAEILYDSYYETSYNDYAFVCVKITGDCNISL